jgi:hypothetical protein
MKRLIHLFSWPPSLYFQPHVPAADLLDKGNFTIENFPVPGYAGCPGGFSSAGASRSAGPDHNFLKICGRWIWGEMSEYVKAL